MISENEISEYLSQLKKVDGLYFADINPKSNDFEANYVKVRESENRILTDKEIKTLPILNNNPHSKEWEKRARSAQRLDKYFTAIPKGNLLDLGCGNGWFTALLSKNKNLEVVGMDVNLTELEQASRVFEQSNLNFIYGDVFQVQSNNLFDYITLNGSAQYFENFNLLIFQLFGLLKSNGEIHIIDSPFYKNDELEAAKARSVNYYKELGFPEMSKSYFFHSWSEVFKFEHKILYKTKRKNILSRLLGKPDMPFPWIKIKKTNG
jgi:ubiquinone/menaquinone biosynthesis C-methylase UbiE